MSTSGAGGGGGGGYSRAPKHQNSFAFKHNPNSRKTRAIAGIPNTGLCGRCHDQIEWKKRYRKYKPLDRPRKCTACHQPAVKSAYHVVCGACAAAKGVCAKCLLDKAIFEPADAATRELREQIEFIETHRGAIPGLPERQRRAVLRELQRELAGLTGGEPPPPGDDDDDGGGGGGGDGGGEVSPAAGGSAAGPAARSCASEDDSEDDDDDEDDEEDEEDDKAEDDDEEEDDDDDKFVSEEAMALKKALAAARTKRRAAEAADRKRAAVAARAGSPAQPPPAAAAAAAAALGGSEDGPLTAGGDARPDPWALQQRLAKMVVTPRIVLPHGAAATATTGAGASVAPAGAM